MTKKYIIIFIAALTLFILFGIAGFVWYKNNQKQVFLKSLPFSTSDISNSNQGVDGVSSEYMQYLGLDPKKSYTADQYKQAYDTKLAEAVDTDKDGIPDAEEIRVGTDPNKATTWEEYLAAFKKKNTNP